MHNLLFFEIQTRKCKTYKLKHLFVHNELFISLLNNIVISKKLLSEPTNICIKYIER